MQVASSPLSVVHRPLKLLFEIKHQRATSRGLHVAGWEKPKTDFGLFTTSNRQSATGERQRKTNTKQRTTDHRQRTFRTNTEAVRSGLSV